MERRRLSDAGRIDDCASIRVALKRAALLSNRIYLRALGDSPTGKSCRNANERLKEADVECSASVVGCRGRSMCLPKGQGEHIGSPLRSL